MFSRTFDTLDLNVRRILDQAVCPPPDRTQELLEKSLREELGLSEVAELLEISADPAADSQFQLLRAFTERQYRKAGGNHVRYIAPIYLSSYCVDTCGYCNFSGARRGVHRTRLSIEALDVELAAVAASGPRVIELVLTTDPELPWPALVPFVERTSEFLKNETGSGVLLCSEYLPFEAYSAFREAGLWGMVQWDETLDRDTYRRWHDASPRKRHFEERLDNHGRAMAAGLEVATGALFGLADARYEVVMQIAKARFLGAEYGRKPFAFGTARLKPIGGRELHTVAEVSDRAYEAALMVYKIAEPAVGRWLQTREAFETNMRNMLDGDAFTYRCGEVRPGGHGSPDVPLEKMSGSQFLVQDLTREAVEQKLSDMLFSIDYTWIGRTEGAASRRIDACTPA